MGHPVTHFEVIAKDGEALQRFYSELFRWEIDAANPMGYGVVAHDDNRGGARHGGEPGRGARLRPRGGARRGRRARPVHRSRGAPDRPDEAGGIAARTSPAIARGHTAAGWAVRPANSRTDQEDSHVGA